jgi:kinesin family protein C2/C3
MTFHVVTGSGKTFTMMGTPDNPGVNRRAVKELIRICDEREHIEYEMSVSLLEIYNEKIMDLLSESDDPGGRAVISCHADYSPDP